MLLCKQQGDRFYGIFTIERPDIVPKQKTDWIAIDPNHKNLFMGIDNTGISYEFQKITSLPYFDSAIDHIKSKRDRCNKKSKQRTTGENRVYHIPSRSWRRRNQALDRAYRRRREQNKSACFKIANWIAVHYNFAAIGNYTPIKENCTNTTLNRSMLNQSNVGKFRRILRWVMQRSGKQCHVVDEMNTTKECCICGYEETKNPSIRQFRCPKCNHILERDINSAVNIAKKANLLSGSDYMTWKLDQAIYTARWSFLNGQLTLTGPGLSHSSLSKKELNQGGDTN